MAVKLKGPENHGGFSHQGVSYEPDTDGLIDVPHEALEDAFSHGFSVVGETDSQVGGSDKPVDLSKLNKKELATYAKEKLGLELDTSKTAKELIAEIEAARAAA